MLGVRLGGGFVSILIALWLTCRQKMDITKI